jgi:hypothetical protein
MYWTWDILLTDNPLDTGSEMESWEDRIAKESVVKLKFPVSVKETEIDGFKMEIKEPEVDSPVAKKKQVAIQTVDTGKKKKDKNSLF